MGAGNPNNYHTHCISLFTYLLLLLLIAPASLPADQLYESNASGIRIRTLPARATRTSYRYVLAVSGRPPTENEILYKDGIMVRRIVRTSRADRNIEVTYQDGIIASEIHYDRNGRLIEEQWFNSNGTLIETLQHEYVVGGKKIRAIDKDNQERYTELHNYDLEGKISSIIRNYPNQRREAAFFDFISELLVREEHIAPESRYIIRYDRLGRATERFLAQNNQLRSAEFLFYRVDETGRPKRTPHNSRLVNYDTSIVENRTYDNLGQIITVEKIQDRATIERGQFEYLNRQLARSVVRSTASSTSREKIFDVSQDVVEERWLDSGKLVRRIVPTGATSYYEERYNNGVLFARVYYQDNDRIREEFIRDGKVVRSREY